MARIAMAVALCLAALASAGDERRRDSNDRDASAARLEQIKRLAGEWVLADAAKDEADEVVAVYKITAGRSAVIETLFPGSDREMITVFYQHHDDLMLTHFCSLGNQPRMKAERGGDPKTLTFRFTDGTNLRTDKDAYMRVLKLTFVDDDRLKAEWTLFDKGSEQSVKTFDLKRKPAK